MPKQTTARTRNNAPAGSSGKPTRKAGADEADKDQPTLKKATRVKDSRIKNHLWAENTCVTYTRHVRQGREWLQKLVVAEGEDE